MPILLICPECKTKLRPKQPTIASTRIRCKKCSAVFYAGTARAPESTPPTPIKAVPAPLPFPSADAATRILPPTLGVTPPQPMKGAPMGFGAAPLADPEELKLQATVLQPSTSLGKKKPKKKQSKFLPRLPKTRRPEPDMPKTEIIPAFSPAEGSPVADAPPPEAGATMPGMAAPLPIPLPPRPPPPKKEKAVSEPVIGPFAAAFAPHAAITPTPQQLEEKPNSIDWRHLLLIGLMGSIVGGGFLWYLQTAGGMKPKARSKSALDEAVQVAPQSPVLVGPPTPALPILIEPGRPVLPPALVGHWEFNTGTLDLRADGTCSAKNVTWDGGPFTFNCKWHIVKANPGIFEIELGDEPGAATNHVMVVTSDTPNGLKEQRHYHNGLLDTKPREFVRRRAAP